MGKKSELRKLNIIWIILLALAIAVFAESSVEVGKTNLTIWDNSDSAVIYDTTRNFFYANYTNATDGSAITGATCNFTFGSTTLSMTYNDTTLLYERSGFTTVGNNTYNVSCNKTGYAHLNVTDIVNVTNRNPIQTALLPNVTIDEDSYNIINLSNYFTDYDNFTGHDENLVWNYTAAENITIIINNNTGFVNITPDADFYGIRNTTITAIDPLNATNVSNVMFINVTNKPEVNLTSPANGNQDYYRNDTIIFRASVEDDYPFANCSLLIDGIFNKTNTSYVAHNGTETEINDTHDAPQDSFRELSSFITPNITKQINTTISINKVKIYAKEQDDVLDTIDEHIVYINDINAFNITDSDVTDSYDWIEYDIDSSLFITNEFNNITIVRQSTDLAISYVRVGIDTTKGDEINRSFYNMTINETGEYMIRLVSVSTEVSFNQTNISKGDHSWNVLCVNNQSQSATDYENFTISIQDSLPGVPNYITCNGAECTGTIQTTGTLNLSCGGSTDIDEDDFDYKIEYKLRNDWNDLTTFNGTLYEWDVTNLGDAQVNLRCAPETATSNYNETDWFTISIPGAPPQLTPENISCNGVQCNNTIFNEDIINITCNTPGDFSYLVEARYMDYNGTNIIEVEDFYPGDGANNISWDTSSIMNQTNVSIWCALSNVAGTTESEEIENITIRKANAPTTPIISFSYADGETVRINCSGSIIQIRKIQRFNLV